MAFEFRRVVTGHDERGLAVVKADEVVSSQPRRPGYDAAVAWCTDSLPVNNNEDAYSAGRPGAKGSRVLLRVGEMLPGGHTPVMHRTETLDYAIVVSGEMEMLLDSGEVVQNLKAGDIVVQRGTNHAWRPVGPEAVRLLFVLIDAEPAYAGGKRLGDFLDNFAPGVSPMPST
jgi:quercetin dioxygenase-like cupin family protein